VVDGVLQISGDITSPLLASWGITGRTLVEYLDSGLVYINVHTPQNMEIQSMHPLSGAWPTMVTPFNSDLKIDIAAYRAMIAWYLQHNVGGLYACCLSSEMFHLQDDERLSLVREAVQAAQGRVPVAATGNLGDSLEDHIRAPGGRCRGRCRDAAGASVSGQRR
jgi:hypothetical protein